MSDQTKQIKELLMDKERFKAMCKSIFDEMDKDKGGSIDINELEAALIKMSKKNGVPAPSKKDIQDTMKIFDKSKDGKIQLDEFIQVTKESYEKMVKNDL
jgi:Ca2+-binding protein (EF-Hand superfamily)